MIYCVRFSDVEAFLRDRGFQLAGETDAHLLYSRPSGFITVHKPNTHDDVDRDRRRLRRGWTDVALIRDALVRLIGRNAWRQIELPRDVAIGCVTHCQPTKP